MVSCGKVNTLSHDSLTFRKQQGHSPQSSASLLRRITASATLLTSSSATPLEHRDGINPNEIAQAPVALRNVRAPACGSNPGERRVRFPS